MAWTDQLKNGSYRGRYKDSKGQSHTAGTATSKRAALKLAQDKESEIRNGTWSNPQSGKVTFSDYFEKQWLPNKVAELNTIVFYQSMYDSCLKDEFGDLALNRIAFDHIQGWVARMSKAGTTPRTIKARFRALQSILASPSGKGVSALRSRLIMHNPCAGVELPTVPQREVTFYEPEEVDAILEVIDPYWRLLPMIASETGARWGELMGLETTDLTLGMRRMKIQRTVVETKVANTGNGTRFLLKDYPKGKFNREIPLDPEVRPAITAYIAEHGLQSGDRLFSMPETMPLVRTTFVEDYTHERTDVWPGGMPISRAFFRQSVWLPTIAAAQVKHPDLPVRRVHDLRASFLTWMFYGELDMATAQELAGHQHLSTTERYVGVMKGADERILAARKRARDR